MAKNVMKLLKPSPHRQRNDFDLSHRHIMSMNFGELIPSTCIETVPGDTIKLHASNLLRAIPMVTSPFLRAKQHLDVWFVPYHDLWHQFDAFITKKDEPVSSAFKAHNYLPYCSLYDLENWANTSQTQGLGTATDILGIANTVNSPRLLNYLGYGKGGLLGSSSDSSKVNLFRLAAYNYIWYNEYRQPYFDDGTNLLFPSVSGLNAAALFNFDDVDCSSVTNANICDISQASGYQSVGGYRLQAMSQMRYRCWKKDLYTGALPSTQFGSVSTIGNFNSLSINNVAAPLDSSEYLGMRVGVSNETLGNQALRKSDGTLVSNSYLWNLSNVKNMDVLSLRRSEAIQIWRENSLRAGNHIKDNMIAHYGTASDFNDHRPTYLGSVSAPLNIGDVMATANSTYSGNTNPNTNVGDIAGKGLSSLDEKVFTYHAKDFGVIMVMASILPEAEYNAQGITRMNQLLEPEDFFVPEYENLGLEAVSSLNVLEVPPSQQHIYGYAPRYYGYKTKLDKCYDFFRTGYQFASWCSPKFDVSQVMATPNTGLPLATLYVNPKIFDVNFSVSYINSPQFLCDFYFDVDAVRPMSVVGLPFS